MTQRKAPANVGKPVYVPSTAREVTVKFRPDSAVVHAVLLDFLARGPKTVLGAARHMGCAPDQVLAALSAVRERGYRVFHDEGRIGIDRAFLPSPQVKLVAPPALTGSAYEFGVVSDTHLCNIHERLDVLNAAYDEFVARGISTVYHAGNIVDGFSQRINLNELSHFRFIDQLHYALDNYPRRPGIVTRYISTYCHEGWWMDIGVNFGEELEAHAKVRGRDDLQHLALMEADVVLSDSAKMRILHPRDGCAYATSYPAQKHVEAMQEGAKPRVLILGHYHKAGCFCPRGVWTVLAMTCCDQTSFMRAKRIRAEVGYIILKVHMSDDGSVSGITYEPRQMFNREFYASKNEWARQRDGSWTPSAAERSKKAGTR